MSFGVLSLAALGAYLALLLCVAEFARRARASAAPADHFLAGRKLGVFVTFLTLYATAYSGNSLLGYPGEAYEKGFVWIQSVGFMMAIAVVFHALAPKLRPIAARENFVSPGDWVRHRFAGDAGARLLCIVIALLMAWALGNFLLAQLQAMGKLLETVSGGLVPHAAGVLGLAALILLYETIGGMRAVAWTDAAQGVIMLLGLATLLGWLFADFGGPAELTAAVQKVRPQAVAPPSAAALIGWGSTTILLGLASVVYPQAIQRIYAAKSGRALKRSFALMSFMPLATTLVVMWIGLAAIPRFEGLDSLAKDGVMPMLLGQWAAGGALASALALLVFVGALAAIMSTADSVLLSLGSVIAVDLFGRPRGAAETTQLGKRAGMIAMALAVALAWNPQLDLWRLIEIKLELLIQCAPAFLLALHWRKLRARAVLCGAVFGTVVAVAPILAGVSRVGGVHVGVIALAVNCIVLLAVQLFVRRRRRRPAEAR